MSKPSASCGQLEQETSTSDRNEPADTNGNTNNNMNKTDNETNNQQTNQKVKRTQSHSAVPCRSSSPIAVPLPRVTLYTDHSDYQSNHAAAASSSHAEATSSVDNEQDESSLVNWMVGEQRNGGRSPCVAPSDPDMSEHQHGSPPDPTWAGFFDPRLPNEESAEPRYRLVGVGVGDQHPVDSLGDGRASAGREVSSSQAGAAAKHLKTEQVMSRHTFKTRLNRYRDLLDRAFAMILSDNLDTIKEGLSTISKLMDKSWATPRIGHDLAYALCDHTRQNGHLVTLLNRFLDENIDDQLRFPISRALENSLSSINRGYLVCNNYIQPVMHITLTRYTETPELKVAAVSLMESMFKHTADTSLKMIEMGALDFIVRSFKCANTTHEILRHAALAILNLAMNSNQECHQVMIAKKMPDWLFMLASHRDSITCYYACLAIVVLAANKEIETAVKRSGTLQLVEPFLLSHRPDCFVNMDAKIARGRPKEWLEKMVSLLRSKLKEANGLAAFHFCMEAQIKKQHDRIEVLQDIGAIQGLQEVASSPNEIAAKLATTALNIIGETVPYKLSQQVPLWSVNDVKYWVNKIGFEQYANHFAEQKVDGDLLLLLSDEELQVDIGMSSGLLRKRFQRELEGLKIAADYSSVDPTELDKFMLSVSERMSKYTYQMLDNGVDRSLLTNVNDAILTNTCGISNPVHRMRLLAALQDCKCTDDMEVAMLSKQIDIFVSYRRRTGNQLASLIKVLLQLRGYKVFIDVDRLAAGQFDASLFKHIRAARHFLLVLTDDSLDRCINDDSCEDWLHKEILCAFENRKSIIPIFDTNFEFPDEADLPTALRPVVRLNGIRWVHEYQDACVDKLERFLQPVGGESVTLRRLNAHSNSRPGGLELTMAPAIQ